MREERERRRAILQSSSTWKLQCPPGTFEGSKTSGCIPGVSYPCNLLKRKLTIIIYYSHLGFKINIPTIGTYTYMIPIEVILPLSSIFTILTLLFQIIRYNQPTSEIPKLIIIKSFSVNQKNRQKTFSGKSSSFVLICKL